MSTEKTITEVIDCRLCGGEGWGDSSALLRRDGNKGSTECLACKGTGKSTRLVPALAPALESESKPQREPPSQKEE